MKNFNNTVNNDLKDRYVYTYSNSLVLNKTLIMIKVVFKMLIFKKLSLLFILILFLLNNCTVLPGINKNPEKKKT